jgi:mono/diheme cytochrome c family protein
VLVVGAFGLIAGAGCRQEMYNQPKYKALRESDFFTDHRQARPLPDGTVARGFLRSDTRLYQGRAGNALVTEFPLKVDGALLARGRERFNIFCSPCHDRTGYGAGMVVRRGYRPPPSFHIDRLRDAPVGHFFDVITRGFGAMPDYAAQIPVNDRWAIIAYVRALQLSQNTRISDVPPAERAKLDAIPGAPAPPTPTPPPVPFLIPGAAKGRAR